MLNVIPRLFMLLGCCWALWKLTGAALGGTGSYILDLLARTYVEQIVLFDDDRVHVTQNPKPDTAESRGSWHRGVMQTGFKCLI